MALRRSLARAALALGAFACAEGANQPAFADDTAAQLRELKALMLEQQKRIQQLWAAVAKSSHESREARKEIHEARKRIAPEEKAATVNAQRESNIINAGTPQGAQVPSKTPVVAQSAPPPVIASFANGLLVESPDHKWSFKVGGRILMDGGGITQPLNGFNNYATFREVRLEVEGKAAGIYLGLA